MLSFSAATPRSRKAEMAGVYVKLFGSILNSSVWCAETETKIVWITMLLLADGEGKVWGAVPGIARQAGVTVEAARRAIEYLGRPDPDSRSKDEAGRRIVTIDGGWQIVNAQKYREMQTGGQRRASERARRYRLRKRNVTERDVTCRGTESRIEEEEESKTEERTTATDLPPSAAVTPASRPWNQRACELFIARYGGIAPGARITKALRLLVTKHGEEAVLLAWGRYLDETEAEYVSVERFASTYGHWSGATPRRPTKAAAVVSSNRAVLERFVKGKS